MIYGYGISGKSIEKYFVNNKCNYNIFDDFKKTSNEKFVTKKYLLNNLKKYDYFVISPSIKIEKNHFLYKYKYKTLIDLDFFSLELSNQKLIGITGTEGKSTICSYLNELLSKKYKTKVIGNFGNTILDKKNLKNYLSNIKYLIIELSSYQLDKLKYLKLHHAFISNIMCDHLDYHDNQKKYIRSKFRIQKFLHLNSNLYISKNIYSKYKSFITVHKKRLIFNNDHVSFKKNLELYFKELNLNLIKNLIQNIDPTINIKNNIFLNELDYRNQLIYKFKNLKIYNDSKCTNLSNAIFKNNLINSRKKILILGGKLKKQQNIKFNISNTLVLMFGNHSNSFLDHLNLINSKFYKFNDLDTLTNFLKLILKVNKFNYVLFSPGGESFDFYKNYKERGKQFTKLIKKVVI